MIKIIPIVLLLLPHVFAIIRVVSPKTLSNTYIRVWPQKYDGNTVNFSPVFGQLVDSTHSNKTDKIVLLRGCDTPYEPEYRKLQAEGVIAVICAVFTPREPGNEMYKIDGSKTSDIHVPIVTAKESDFNFITWEKNKTVIVCIETEPNEYITVYESGWAWAWQGSLIIFALFNTAFALARIYKLAIHFGGCKPTVGLAAVVLCFIASIEMLFVFSTDPLGMRRLLPWWARGVIFALPLPIVLAPLFLMTLWWHTLLGSLRVQLHPRLPSFRWVFYVWITFLIVQELVVSSISAVMERPSIFVLLISPCLDIIGFTIVLTYCVVTLVRLKQRVEKIKVRSKDTKRHLRIIKYELYAIIIGIMAVYTLFIVLFTGVTFHPASELIFFWFVWVVMCSLITIQLFALRPPRKGGKRDSTTGDTPTIIETHLRTNDLLYKHEQTGSEGQSKGDYTEESKNIATPPAAVMNTCETISSSKLAPPRLVEEIL